MTDDEDDDVTILEVVRRLEARLDRLERLLERIALGLGVTP